MKKKMSNYVNNLNELINTKNEFKEIIIESGQTPGEVFSYYPNMIRNAIAASGASEEAVNSYISAYLSAYNYIDQDTLSSNSYITESDVAQMGYITMGDVSACGYLTQHQDLSSYATKSYVVDYVATYAPTPDLSSYITSDELAQELSSYVTKTELSAQSYATTTDLDNYLPYLGTLQTHYTNSEHFIPKANNTYYLGNNNFKWQLVYTYNIYTNTAYLQDTSYSSSIVPKETGTYTLGSSVNQWAYTYTSYLILNGTNIMDIIGDVETLLANI